MTQETVKLQIPFESLVNAISASLLRFAIANLSLKEKRVLSQMLDEEINQTEADLPEQDTYDWEPDGQPKGKPVEYIPGVGLAVIGGKDAPT